MAEASSMLWYDHILRKENIKVKTLKFVVRSCTRRPKQTWKKQVENEEKWTAKRECM